MPIAISTFLASMKVIADIEKDAGKLDLNQPVIELRQRLFGAIAENTRMTVENASLARRVSGLQRSLSVSATNAERGSALQFQNDA